MLCQYWEKRLYSLIELRVSSALRIPLRESILPLLYPHFGGYLPMWLSSGELVVALIEGVIAEHGVADVAASAGEGHDGLTVAFALGGFVVAVGA